MHADYLAKMKKRAEKKAERKQRRRSKYLAGERERAQQRADAHRAAFAGVPFTVHTGGLAAGLSPADRLRSFPLPMRSHGDVKRRRGAADKGVDRQRMAMATGERMAGRVACFPCR
jgi:hypothetical protein